MSEFYETVLFSILNIVLPYLITREDRKRLDAHRLSRAWNGPSWACAVYFFGPLCLPAHFWVTRRKGIAVLQGVLWMTAIFGLEYLLGAAIEALAT